MEYKLAIIQFSAQTNTSTHNNNKNNKYLLYKAQEPKAGYILK